MRLGDTSELHHSKKNKNNCAEFSESGLRLPEMDKYIILYRFGHRRTTQITKCALFVTFTSGASETAEYEEFLRIERREGRSPSMKLAQSTPSVCSSHVFRIPLCDPPIRRDTLRVELAPLGGALELPARGGCRQDRHSITTHYGANLGRKTARCRLLDALFNCRHLQPKRCTAGKCGVRPPPTVLPDCGGDRTVAAAGGQEEPSGGRIRERGETSVVIDKRESSVFIKRRFRSTDSVQ